MTNEESSRYAARIEVDFPETCSRGLALLGVVFLLKGLLLLPHVIVLYFLSLAAAIAMYLAFLVVLISGRYPRGIFDFTVGSSDGLSGPPRGWPDGPIDIHHLPSADPAEQRSRPDAVV